MYIQLIQGKVADEERLRRRLDQWESELMPGAVGYLGTTAGFCDDGTFVALARFESAEAARRNSQRPEQSAWWADTATCFPVRSLRTRSELTSTSSDRLPGRWSS